MMMHAFLRGADKELSAGNINVSFDDLKLGDLSKLCNATACLLMRNQDYMKMSAQKNISGHQIQERLRTLVRKVEKMQVGCLAQARVRSTDMQFRLIAGIRKQNIA